MQLNQYVFYFCFALLHILRWCHFHLRLETLGEVFRIGETHLERYFRDRQVALLEQLQGMADAQLADKVGRRQTGGFLDACVVSGAAHAEMTGYIVDEDVAL